MKEPYEKGLANRLGPASCAGDGNIAGVAGTGVHAGQVLTSEITTPACRPCPDMGKATRKIVQQATKTVLECVYEADFLGFSYGFRPGRGCHNALDALWVGLTSTKVNCVLDADLRGFFDAIDHEWLLKFVQHRIADRRILRLLRKWLRAGVSEDGQWMETKVGTPPGSVISPLLANVFLHYVFDLWIEDWRKRHATGDMIVVRYADDFVIGFQHRSDAERCLGELRERFCKFGFELHPEKTRLIEFGRFAAERRAQRGQGKPETFNFLGFTHISGKTRKGAFTIQRQSMAKKMRAKLVAVRQCVPRGRPFGDERWAESIVHRLGSESTMRPRGRPRTTTDGSETGSQYPQLLQI